VDPERVVRTVLFTDIGRSTGPVGMCPHGRRPGGPDDMAGNVLEGTASVHKKYQAEDDDGWETRRINTEDARPVGSGSVGFRCCSRSPV